MSNTRIINQLFIDLLPNFYSTIVESTNQIIYHSGLEEKIVNSEITPRMGCVD